MHRLISSLVLLLALALCLPGSGGAQTRSRTDSLLQALHASQRDTNRVSLLLALAGEYLQSDPARALSYGTTALPLAHTFKDGQQISRSLYVVGSAHYKLGDYTLAISYYKQSLRVAGQIGLKANMARAYGGIAEVYGAQGDYNKALDNIQHALNIARALGDKASISAYTYHLSMTYKYMGNYAKALEYELKTLRLAEENRNPRMIAQVNNSLGMSFYTQGNLAKAKEYFLKSLQWSREHEEPMMADNLSNLGNVYFRQHKYDTALVYYQQSLHIREGIKELKGIHNALEDIGQVYLRQGQLQKARSSCQQALSMARQLNDRRGIARAQINLAGIYQAMGQPASALDYGDQGIRLARKIGAKDLLKDGYGTLIGLAEKRGDYQQAFRHLKLYTQYQDSLADEATNDKMNELHARYESEKKEQQIKGLSQQAQIQQLELEQQRLYLFGLAVLVLVIVLLGYLFFRQSILRNQHKTIDLEQKLLRAQMNPHFIFNALTAIQQFMYANHPAEAGRYLSKFAKLMRLTLENSRDEYITLQKEIQTLEHYFELQRLRFGDKFDYTILVDPELDPEEVAVPPMFAQPLVENSLEHGILHKSDKGLVQVRYRKLADSLVLEVEDNGVGRKRAAQLTPVGGRRQYASLATQITQERLKLFNRNKSHKVKLTLVDLVDDDNVVLGTKATFAIPYKPLNN